MVRPGPRGLLVFAALASSPALTVAVGCPCETIEEPQLSDDPTDVLFNRSRVIPVSVRIDPDRWDELRHQARPHIPDIVGVECNQTYSRSPYTYFPADVEIDGHRFANVGVRSKGYMGSVNPMRPSLKIKLSEYEADQELHGRDRLTLNNAQQDPSRIRTCLTYQFFRDAGLPAPRCNFARVTVNDQDLGVYVHVEPIRRPFLRRHFNDDQGALYEGTQADFTDYLMNRIEPKLGDAAAADPTIRAMTEALKLTDDELLGALEPLIDLEAFYRFWAAETITGHWDGYTGDQNNFYLYREQTRDKLYFIPWGPDSSFGDQSLQKVMVGPLAIHSRLAWRLFRHPEGNRAFYAAVEEVMAAWDPCRLRGEVTRYQRLLEERVLPDARRHHVKGLDQIREFIGDREGEIDGLLADRPEWPHDFQGWSCFEESGWLELTFSVPYANDGLSVDLGAEILLPIHGEGSFSANLAGREASGDIAGAVGPSKAGMNLWKTEMLFQHDMMSFMVMLWAPPSIIKVGEPISLGTTRTLGAVADMSDSEDPRDGLICDGQLLLDSYGTEDGDIVSGTLTATVCMNTHAGVEPPDLCGCRQGAGAGDRSRRDVVLLLLVGALVRAARARAREATLRTPVTRGSTPTRSPTEELEMRYAVDCPARGAHRAATR